MKCKKYVWTNADNFSKIITFLIGIFQCPLSWTSLQICVDLLRKMISQTSKLLGTHCFSKRKKGDFRNFFKENCTIKCFTISMVSLSTNKVSCILDELCAILRWSEWEVCHPLCLQDTCNAKHTKIMLMSIVWTVRWPIIVVKKWKPKKYR